MGRATEFRVMAEHLEQKAARRTADRIRRAPLPRVLHLAFWLLLTFAREALVRL
jgi:hypothetical protein